MATTWLLLGLVAAGCFTDPINRAPVVSPIQASPPTFMHGDQIQFTASAFDPDQDPVVLTWARVPGDCLDSADRANWPPDRAPGSPATGAFVVTSEQTLAPFCVWVFATDGHGAVDVKTIQENPGNRSPVAQITVTQPEMANPFPLYSDFRLAASGSSDPEGGTLTYTWTLDDAPSGSTASAGGFGCPMGGADVACFFADLPGVYKISLLVRDPDGGQSTAQMPLIVDQDRPPCIVASSPDYRSSNLIRDPMDMETEHFSIDRVSDDGDPYIVGLGGGPHGQTAFSWWIGKNDDPLQIVLNDNFPSLDIAPGSYALGDTVRVRVEISDRNTRTIQDYLDACVPEKALCEAPLQPGCLLRVTWSIRYQ